MEFGEQAPGIFLYAKYALFLPKRVAYPLMDCCLGGGVPMGLISRDELKEKLDRGDDLRLVMVLED